MVGSRLGLVAAVLMLAGCSGTPPAGDDGAEHDAGHGDMADMNATMHAAPAWATGQWWDHEWKLGTDGEEFTVKSIVAGNSSTDYVLAADTAENAAFAAAFFFNDIGRMSKTDWTVRDGAFSYPWYDFPLEDNKTWSAVEDNLDFELQPVTRQLQLKATALPNHRFAIEATEDGVVRAKYDYDPGVGWFTKFESYSLNATGVLVPDYSITTTASGAGYKGPYHQATADLVLNEISVVSPPGMVLDVSPAKTFRIGDDATHVLALLFSFAAPGASHAELTAPDGQHWEATAVADPNGANVAGSQPDDIFVPAVPGDWNWATAGAGGFAWGGGAFAWALTMTSGTLS